MWRQTFSKANLIGAAVIAGGTFACAAVLILAVFAGEDPAHQTWGTFGYLLMILAAPFYAVGLGLVLLPFVLGLTALLGAPVLSALQGARFPRPSTDIMCGAFLGWLAVVIAPLLARLSPGYGNLIDNEQVAALGTAVGLIGGALTGWARYSAVGRAEPAARMDRPPAPKPPLPEGEPRYLFRWTLQMLKTVAIGGVLSAIVCTASYVALGRAEIMGMAAFFIVPITYVASFGRAALLLPFILGFAWHLRPTGHGAAMFGLVAGAAIGLAMEWPTAIPGVTPMFGRLICATLYGAAGYLVARNTFGRGDAEPIAAGV